MPAPESSPAGASRPNVGGTEKLGHLKESEVSGYQALFIQRTPGLIVGSGGSEGGGGGPEEVIGLGKDFAINPGVSPSHKEVPVEQPNSFHFPGYHKKTEM